MHSALFPEHLLRIVWQEQSFAAAHLRTSDGKPVTILSPGTFNTDAGPDFIDARIRIGNTLYRGDVELHSDAAEWYRHNHESDPHYNRVILHVVMTAEDLSIPARTSTLRPIPLLVLHPYLDERVRSRWSDDAPESKSEQSHSLRCNGLNDGISASLMARWVMSLATERLELKVRRIEERLKQIIDDRRSIVREPYPRYYGNPDEIPLPQRAYSHKDFLDKRIWEQALYEGIMEGFGYAKNREPFLALAQSMQLDILRRHDLRDRHMMMALLFGSAGLLPSTRTLKEKESRAYVRPLRGTWKTFRKTFRAATLNEADWLFFRLRPGNFPTARLASMCLLLPSLFGENGFRRLIGIFKDVSLTAKKRTEALHTLFLFEPDEYWSRHYHFKGAAGRSGITIGTDRINDVIVNTIIPTVLLYARLFKDNPVRAHARAVLTSLGASQDNSTLRMMESQLTKRKIRVTSSLQQQGLLQLYKFYCAPVRCAECRIGQQVFGGASIKRL